MKLARECCSCSLDRSTRSKLCFAVDCFHKWSRGRINKGHKSLEMRQKLSTSTRGVSSGPFSEEHQKNMSLARKGMKFSESHCHALSATKVKFLVGNGFHERQSDYISQKTGERNWAYLGFELELMKQFDANDDVVR